MKTKILKLREQGKTYDEIKAILSCSKSTISYYCGEGQKDKNYNRSKLRRNSNCLHKKVETFRIKLKDKIQRFKDSSFALFNVTDVLKMYGENPICYLSGRKLDWSNPKEVTFDHKTPRSRGGSCEIDNLGICHKQINAAKSDLTPEEFIELCKEVLIHNNYTVTKSGGP